jgi:hypothetical protein
MAGDGESHSVRSFQHRRRVLERRTICDWIGDTQRLMEPSWYSHQVVFMVVPI